MIKGCSEDLHIYLIEYLQLLVDVGNEIEKSIKEKFLAIIIKWITKRWISIENTQLLSMRFYEYIFTCLDNSQFLEGGFVNSRDVYSHPHPPSIQTWFRNKLNMNSEKKYSILLQQTVYTNENSLDHEGIRLVIEHIHTYSTEIMDKFVLDFYNYLCNEYKDNYFSVSKPNYIHIAMELIDKDFNEFQNAVKKSSFGIEKFQHTLYRCFSYSDNEINCTRFVNLYAKFGIITMELVHMLKSSKTSYDNYMWNYFDNIKRLSNRDVIDELFQILDFMLINIEFICFSFILRLLVQLAQVHAISLFEVHQHISIVIENLSSDHDYTDELDKNHIFQYLLNLSCAKETQSSLSKVELITEKDINKEFYNELYYISKGGWVGGCGVDASLK